MRPSDYRAPLTTGFLLTAARIAWRELRASPVKSLFVIAATASGVASLGGIQGAIAVFQTALSRDLREWIAADVSVQTTEPPDREQTAVLEELERRGLERTAVIQTSAQVTSDDAPDPQLVLAKVVDPGKYPFYGRVQLSPPLGLAQALDGDSVVVSEDLPGRLNTPLGSVIEVNGKRLHIRAILQSEPDQLTITPTPLPRIMVSYPAGEITGLLRPRTSYYQRILLRLPAGTAPEPIQDALARAFPGRKVLDYLHPDPQAAAILRQVGGFLRAISVIVLLIGAVAVATAIWSHIEQRLDSIAIVKTLGGTSRHVLAIYGLQTACLTLAGSVVGVLCGVGVERAIATIAPRLLSAPLKTAWNWSGPLEAAAVGIFAGMLVPLPVLLRVRQVRPYRILMRAMNEASRAPSRLRKRWAGIAARRFPLAIRHGAGNIMRPGNHAVPVLAAMGAAATLWFAIHLLQRSVIADLTENFPPASANLFLVNIEPEQVATFEKLLQAQPGLEERPVLAPFYSVRVLKVDGRGIDQLPKDSLGRIEAAGLLRRWLAARLDRPPNIVEIVEGSWWSGSSSGVIEVALPRMAARTLGAGVGSHIEFEASSLVFTARVAAIDRIGPLDRFRCCFLFNSAAPVQPGASYHGVARLKPANVPAVRLAIYRAFPTITTVDVTESIRLLEAWLNSVLWSVRVIAILSMAAAAVLLGSVVAATRLWRIREIAVLKAIGAGRRQLFWIYSVEFTLLGGIAALSGALLASCGMATVWRRVAGAAAQPSASAFLIAIAGAVVIANTAGWLAAFRFIGQKPLETLREE